MPDLSNPTLERRRHEREPASGPITLWWTDCVPCTIDGNLLDQSKSGLRLAHHCFTLGPGQQVNFQHAGGKGTARTIWTRIVEDSVESGLLILPDDHPEFD